MTARFSRSDAIHAVPDQVEEIALGPYPWLQLTYTELRAGEDGDTIAAYDADADAWQIYGVLGYWSKPPFRVLLRARQLRAQGSFLASSTLAVSRSASSAASTSTAARARASSGSIDESASGSIATSEGQGGSARNTRTSTYESPSHDVHSRHQVTLLPPGRVATHD